MAFEKIQIVGKSTSRELVLCPEVVNNQTVQDSREELSVSPGCCLPVAEKPYMQTLKMVCISTWATRDGAFTIYLTMILLS